MVRHVHAFFAVFLLIGAPSLGQMILPTGFTATDLIPSGLSASTSMCMAPDGTLYIAQKNGALRVWREGTGLLGTQFFANEPLSVQTSGERGLLGVAIDPNFSANRFIYVHYTVNATPRHGRISRFTADADGNLAIQGSEAVLLELDPLSSSNHNGGAIQFGPDGMLYVGVGDNQVGANAQSINNLFGKILRIKPTPGDVIPPDNPTSFAGVAGAPVGNNRAIWALGLRNPFSIALQPVSGRIFINDVGSSAFEEINEGASGRNFGWPTTEGSFDESQYPTFTTPVHSYEHNPDWGGGVCIVGGAFYNPPLAAFPSHHVGDYFFADYQQNGWIRRLDLETGSVSEFALLIAAIVDLDVDSQGRLWVLSHSRLIRIEYSAPPPQCQESEVASLNLSTAAPGSGFGTAIAISNDTLVVGAPFVDTANGVDAGAAYIFTRSGQNWTEQAMLTANDGMFGDWFGMAVAISENRVLIGAPWHDGGSISGSGAVYAFVRNGSVWSLQTKLIAPDAHAQDHFGAAVEMTSEFAVIGANQHSIGNVSGAGAAYVYLINGTEWTFHSMLAPSDPSINADFGESISIEPNRLLIGAGNGNANKGCAYVFDLINGVWTQSARLVATDGMVDDQFGASVSLSGNSALIGARNAVPVGLLRAGAAYHFAQVGDSWTQSHRFTATAPNAYGAFGRSVHLSGNQAVINAPYSSRDGDLFQGTAYCFSQTNGGWDLSTTLAASDANQNDCFGGAIGADDSVVLIGQDLNNLPIAEAGTVYEFVVSQVKGDLNQDGDVDLADLAIFVDVLIGVDSIPIHFSRSDMNCDGTPNGQDISYFINIIIESP